MLYKIWGTLYISQLKPYRIEEYSEFILDIISNYDDFRYINLYDDKKGYNLSRTEKFYIVSLLSEAKEVSEINFTLTKELNYYIDRKKTIKTNGRYFQYTNKSGEEKMLDIGFNVIEKNNWDGVD